MTNFMPDILAPIRINKEWLMPKKCIVENCSNEMEGPLCPTHWFKLSMELRHKWWKETDYGNKEASDELKKEIQAALSPQTA